MEFFQYYYRKKIKIFFSVTIIDTKNQSGWNSVKENKYSL